MNSFQYLWSKYPGVYGGTQLIIDKDGDGIDDKDLTATRDLLLGGWQHEGQRRAGMVIFDPAYLMLTTDKPESPTTPTSRSPPLPCGGSSIY